MLKIRIRTKLAAALAVPLVALVAISGFEAVQASREADDVDVQAELASVSIGPSSLTTELQNERNYTALDLIGLAESVTLEVSSVAEARERVDASLERLRSYVSGRGTVVSDAFAPAFDAIDADLAATRALWDDFDGDKTLENEPLADELYERFTVMTQAFFDATESVALAIEDNSLRNGAEIVEQANRRGELLASITRTIVVDQLTEGGEGAARSEVAAQRARVETTEERIEQLSTGAYSEVAAETLGREWDVESEEIIDGYIAGDDVEITGLLEAVSAGGRESVVSTAEMASSILASEANDLVAEANDRQRQFVLLAAGVVILAIVSSWLASRSITQPLRKLRAEADEMARVRLPKALDEISATPLGEDVVIPELDTIQVKTRDEVHEVVDVLNDVQERTLVLAADQAVLRRNIADSFVNLGRRNQNLLDRQLEFITELEQSETEPEELESLFRLDHLATRMRRNAESLLVLAGVESPRQWSAPVAADDVVRAALGEVEDYQRVNVRHLDAVAVAGEAAAAVSHVLAELIENALNYSPPGSIVEIKGRQTAAGYVVAIDDDGIGMSADDLERANRRLSGDESYTVAPSRYLGHYVAGHLAQRYGIAVRLQDSPAGGVTATVALPTSMLSDPKSAPAVPERGTAVDEPAPTPETVPVDRTRVDDDTLEAWVHAGREETPVAAVEPAEHRDDADERAPEPAGEPWADQPVAAAGSDGSEADADWDDDRWRITPDPSFAGAGGARDADSESDRSPATLSEALGRPRIDGIRTADDLTAAIDGESSGSSLPRRVPGAQRPDLQPTIARRPGDAALPQRRPDDDAKNGTDATSSEATPRTDAFGFLAGFSSAGSDHADHAPDSTDPHHSTEDR